MLLAETWVHGAAGEWVLEKHVGTDHHLIQRDKEHRKRMLHAAVQLHVLLLQFLFQRCLHLRQNYFLRVFQMFTLWCPVFWFYIKFSTSLAHLHVMHIPPKKNSWLYTRFLCQLHCIKRHSLSSLQMVCEDHWHRDDQEYVGLVRPARCWPDLRTWFHCSGSCTIWTLPTWRRDSLWTLLIKLGSVSQGKHKTRALCQEQKTKASDNVNTCLWTYRCRRSFFLPDSRPFRFRK